MSKEPSSESLQQARSVIASCGLDQTGMGMGAETRQETLVIRFAIALDRAWNQGFEDAETAQRLKRMGVMR